MTRSRTRGTGSQTWDMPRGKKTTNPHSFVYSELYSTTRNASFHITSMSYSRIVGFQTGEHKLDQMNIKVSIHYFLMLKLPFKFTTVKYSIKCIQYHIVLKSYLSLKSVTLTLLQVLD